MELDEFKIVVDGIESQVYINVTYSKAEVDYNTQDYNEVDDVDLIAVNINDMGWVNNVNKELKLSIEELIVDHYQNEVIEEIENMLD